MCHEINGTEVDKYISLYNPPFFQDKEYFHHLRKLSHVHFLNSPPLSNRLSYSDHHRLGLPILELHISEAYNMNSFASFTLYNFLKMH